MKNMEKNNDNESLYLYLHIIIIQLLTYITIKFFKYFIYIL